MALLDDCKIKVKVKVLNFGDRSNDACPIILCVDGGASSTTVYPPVNGLLNGGTV